MAFQIAIDGPSGSGKSTVAKKVAKLLDYIYFSTGKMYRAFAYLLLKNRLEINQLLKVIDQVKWHFDGDLVLFNNSDISDLILSQEVADIASKVLAVNPKLRKIAVRKQQELASNKNIVMDGRDIASVVLPNANLKFYLDANVKIRAQRRCMQLSLDWNDPAIKEELINQMQQRDETDSKRTHGPLIKVADAIVIDSSNMTFDEVVNFIVDKTKAIS